MEKYYIMMLIDILIAAIVIVVIVYVAKLVLDMLELPAPVRQIAMLIIGLIVLIVVLGWFGVGTDLQLGSRR